MFIFYYAVLSEVTPPTALAAVAAAAITGGNVDRDDVAGVEVHAAGVPGPDRLRASPTTGRTCSCRATSGRSSGPPRCRWSRSPRWPRSPAAGSSARPRWPQRLLCVPAALLLLYLQPVTIGDRPGLPRRRRRREPDHPSAHRPTRGGTVMIRRSRLLPAVAVGLRRGRSSLAALRRPAAAAPPRPRTADASACQAGTGQITIATGNATGVYYALGGGLAQPDLRQHHAEGDRGRDRRVGAEHPAAGRRRVRHRVLAGRHRRRRGRAARASFTEPQQVQALARIYSNYTHVVVQRSSGITTMADFRGKRISTGSPEVGHRGDRQPAAAGGRPQPRDRRPAAAARAGQDRRRA